MWRMLGEGQGPLWSLRGSLWYGRENEKKNVYKMTMDRRGNPNWVKGMMPTPKFIPNGRPKGVPNKLTMEAKEIIATAAANLGGVDGLVKWAKSNPDRMDMFWTRIFPRLVPVQVHGDLRQTITAIRQIIVSPEGEENIIPPIFGDGSQAEDAEFETVKMEEHKDGE